jgi:hypothetical protein
LLWMTHPSWPSNMWQIYSSDYDTHASYYGVKSACEPLHAQMNLPDYSLAVVNTTRQERSDLRLTSRVLSLDGRVLAQRSDRVKAAANSTTTLPELGLAPILAREDLVLVVLTLDASDGGRISENLYWQGRDDSSQQKLSSLTQQRLTINTHAARRGEEFVVDVELENPGSVPALAAKLTAIDDAGERVLPVLYSDNYLTVLPREPRKVQIRCPAAHPCSQVKIRGWNVTPAVIRIADRP